MTDPSILAIRRQLAFQRAAESLEVDATLPSTRAPSIYMETYLTELLLASQSALISSLST